MFGIDLKNNIHDRAKIPSMAKLSFIMNYTKLFYKFFPRYVILINFKAQPFIKAICFNIE